MKRLAGKTALVTGASSGIGRAIAQKFADEGALLVLMDVTDQVREGGQPTHEILGVPWFQGDVSHEADVRTGGRYQLVMRHPSVEQPMAFFGRYIEVTPPSLIVWTNDEGDGEGAITRVRFEADGDATRVVVQEIYPSIAARDAAVESGETGAWGEQLDQLDALIAGRTTGT